ncbi:uncharacterized protein LOC124161852 [Ischnura elegans]|uniref:uncharacterized protein LOC124161852 n=1 Tax=Ischnura elegans TaxID=197161 RepID=UPI001ED89414|nr:uncharacterized protein LOC124161852 [Ischnura elegans]
MFGRTLRSRLTLLKPNLSSTVALKQSLLKESGDGLRIFQVGDEVWVTAYNRGGTRDWVQATVEDVLGSRNYRVLTEKGQRWHRHINQMRRSKCSELKEGPFKVCMNGLASPMSVFPSVPVSSPDEECEPVGYWESKGLSSDEHVGVGEMSSAHTRERLESCGRRYPLRQRVPKKRLNL